MGIIDWDSMLSDCSPIRQTKSNAVMISVNKIDKNKILIQNYAKDTL